MGVKATVHYGKNVKITVLDECPVCKLTFPCTSAKLWGRCDQNEHVCAVALQTLLDDYHGQVKHPDGTGVWNPAICGKCKSLLKYDGFSQKCPTCDHKTITKSHR